MVQDKLMFTDLSCFSTGGYIVQRTIAVCTFSMKLFWPEVKRCRLKIFLFLALVAVQFGRGAS